MGTPCAFNGLQFAPGFTLVFGEGIEHEVIQQAAGGGVANGHLGIFTEVGIAQGNDSAIGQGSDLATAGVRTAKLIGVEHPLGCAPGLAAVGTAAQEAGTIGAFEGFANHHSGQKGAVSKLADIGESCLAAAELRNGILINDIQVQYFHNKPPNIYGFDLSIASAFRKCNRPKKPFFVHSVTFEHLTIGLF